MPDLDGSGLFKEIAQGDSVSYGELAVGHLTQFTRRASDCGLISDKGIVAFH